MKNWAEKGKKPSLAGDYVGTLWQSVPKWPCWRERLFSFCFPLKPALWITKLCWIERWAGTLHTNSCSGSTQQWIPALLQCQTGDYHCPIHLCSKEPQCHATQTSSRGGRGSPRGVHQFTTSPAVNSELVQFLIASFTHDHKGGKKMHPSAENEMRRKCWFRLENKAAGAHPQHWGQEQLCPQVAKCGAAHPGRGAQWLTVLQLQQFLWISSWFTVPFMRW